MCHIELTKHFIPESAVSKPHAGLLQDVYSPWRDEEHEGALVVVIAHRLVGAEEPAASSGHLVLLWHQGGHFRPGLWHCNMPSGLHSDALHYLFDCLARLRQLLVLLGHLK